ncbi:hypothetical protein [Streptomyces telluris]|uniref:Uncharacterized protein n=1 Tax=Streptomyces telluris TaxID=2720021 RepID=A0A9X2LIU5_9ACTN|nr:hypothetical protein [Streptomyces telluris]MCQ8772097.1 hypothetical protein [Streptomyces telluris]NJP82479.1 hypothetical protein [Streptomyces telluris]
MSDTRDFSGLDGGAEQQAFDIVRDVVSWYNAQIASERRSPVPDEERVEQFKAGRQAALDDQARLEAADPQQTAQIAAVYAARLKELKES